MADVNGQLEFRNGRGVKMREPAGGIGMHVVLEKFPGHQHDANALRADKLRLVVLADM